MSEKIISSSVIKTVVNNGKNLTLEYATETEAWKRSQLAQSVKDGFSKAMEKADVPDTAASAIMS